MRKFDCIIVGGGHNGLIAACYLAMAGKDVLVMEANNRVGGATASVEVFPGVPAKISKYSYLISLLPKKIRDDLSINLQTVKRTVSSYTPDPSDPSRGLLVPVGRPEFFKQEMERVCGTGSEADSWGSFYGRLSEMAGKIFPTLTEPLRSRDEIKAMINDDELWIDLFENPIGETIERYFQNDVVRGVVLTDALIGTFASAGDRSLLQNKCFLYHVIGNGTGDWDVPVGGMGELVNSLVKRARSLGVVIMEGCPVTKISPNPDSVDVSATVSSTGGQMEFSCKYLLANCSPRVLENLLPGNIRKESSRQDSGSQIKVNMLLKRLPRLKDSSVNPHDAFSGTFHINETYSQLEAAFADASEGRLPKPIPAEIYCHSLTDPSILGEELRNAGAQTLTLFALHTPHHLFENSNDEMKKIALEEVLNSLNSVLDEPIQSLFWEDVNGNPCVEISTTVDIETALNIPGGNIFHTPLEWPFAEEESEINTWGVETDHDRIVMCGSGARRGGGVSGIAGHNAAKYVLQRDP
jgi:phytoene dehydrogenase-like protein